ncbi:MAG: lipoyl synthase [candidate division WOR-3 bacterium]
MRKPSWLKTRLPLGEEFNRVNAIISKYNLNTVCSSARCPNLSECWNSGTATIMLLGDICTRHCRFCSVKTGNPQGRIDPDEPQRVAKAVKELGLKYLVLTSVDRDDLSDLGAGIFARTVKILKSQNPEIKIEVLVPDFGGREELLHLVVDSGPDVFAHNLETVERLSSLVRDHRSSYHQSLGVLKKVKNMAPTLLTKSGLMLGLGETKQEVLQTLADLRSAGCDIVTIGQYLQPNRRCLPVARYWTPDEFKEIEAEGRKMGFRQVFAAPLVRSSYQAEKIFFDERA